MSIGIIRLCRKYASCQWSIDLEQNKCTDVLGLETLSRNDIKDRQSLAKIQKINCSNLCCCLSLHCNSTRRCLTYDNSIYKITSHFSRSGNKPGDGRRHLCEVVQLHFDHQRRLVSNNHLLVANLRAGSVWKLEGSINMSDGPWSRTLNHTVPYKNILYDTSSVLSK